MRQTTSDPRIHQTPVAYVGAPSTHAIVLNSGIDTGYLITSGTNEASFSLHALSLNQDQTYQSEYNVSNPKLLQEADCGSPYTNMTYLTDIVENGWVSSDSDGFIRVNVYDSEKGELGIVDECEMHDSACSGFDVERNVKMVVSCGEDGRVGLYDVGSMKMVQRSQVALNLSIDCVKFCTPYELIASSAGSLNSYDTRQKLEPVSTYYTESTRIWSIDPHPDQPYLTACGDTDGNIMLWDSRVATDDGRAKPYFYTRVHDGPIWDIVFDANRIISAGDDGCAYYTNLQADNSLIHSENNMSKQILETNKLISFPTPLCSFSRWNNHLLIGTESQAVIFLMDVLSDT